MIKWIKRITFWAVLFPLVALFAPIWGMFLFAPVVILVFPIILIKWLYPPEDHLYAGLLVGVVGGLILYHYRHKIESLYSRYLNLGSSLIKPLSEPFERLATYLEK